MSDAPTVPLDSVVFSFGYGRNAIDARPVIERGSVKVNGKVVRDHACAVSPGDLIEVNARWSDCYVSNLAENQ